MGNAHSEMFKNFRTAVYAGKQEEKIQTILCTHDKDKKKLEAFLKFKGETLKPTIPNKQSEPMKRTAVQMIIASYANFNNRGGAKLTPLLQFTFDKVMSAGGEQLLQTLLSERDNAGNNSLMLLCASADCDTETLQMIFDAVRPFHDGFPFVNLFSDQTNHEGETAFHVLCQNNALTVDTFRFFVTSMKEACKSDVNFMKNQFTAKTKVDGFSVLQKLSKRYGSSSEELLKVFFESFEEHCCPSSSSSPTTIIKEHLINHRDSQGASAFMTFCSNDSSCNSKSLPIFINLITKTGGNELLLEQLNVKTSDGYTALMRACLYNSPDVVAYLLDVIKSQNSSVKLLLRSQLLENKTTDDALPGLTPLTLLVVNFRSDVTVLKLVVDTIKDGCCLVSETKDEEAKTVLKEQFEQKLPPAKHTVFTRFVWTINKISSRQEKEKFMFVKEVLSDLGIFEEQFAALPDNTQALLREKEFVD